MLIIKLSLESKLNKSLVLTHHESNGQKFMYCIVWSTLRSDLFFSLKEISKADFVSTLSNFSNESGD